MARALGTQLLNYSRTKLEAISMEYGYDLKPSAACHRRRALILYALFLRQRNTRRNRLSIERIRKLQVWNHVLTLDPVIAPRKQ